MKQLFSVLFALVGFCKAEAQQLDIQIEQTYENKIVLKLNQGDSISSLDRWIFIQVFEEDGCTLVYETDSLALPGNPDNFFHEYTLDNLTAGTNYVLKGRAVTYDGFNYQEWQCSKTAKTEEATTGLEDIKASQVIAYPNPFTAVLTVSVPQKTSAKLVDMSGREVQTFILESGSNNLDTGRFLYI
jgi:hypothetical protein